MTGDLSIPGDSALPARPDRPDPSAPPLNPALNRDPGSRTSSRTSTSKTPLASSDNDQPRPQPIAWIGDPRQPQEQGQWGRPDQLSLPLDDRGLTLADGLFETVLVERGQVWLLEAHLERWRRSAALLGMELPPPAELLEPLIAEALRRSLGAVDGPRSSASKGSRKLPPAGNLPRAPWLDASSGGLAGALRLNWSRGSAQARGIDLPAEGEPPLAHRFWLQFTPLQPCFQPVTVWISQLERRQATSLLSQCKTFAYGQAIQARREARSAGAEEALLLGTSGELCCGATSNLVVLREGTWLTPPLASGCLPGVMRGRALALGLVREAPLDPALLLQQAPGDVQGSGLNPDQEWRPGVKDSGSVAGAAPGPIRAALLLNSLGCRPIRAVNGQRLGAADEASSKPGWASELAESFWRRVLGDGEVQAAET